ncbi:hypothetical protein LX36DRAFT_216783 [Colletotrichum falcatum]|nr:hypothetical protein LX36DRAFT_216783 [Colletotrichum falcatum]
MSSFVTLTDKLALTFCLALEVIYGYHWDVLVERSTKVPANAGNGGRVASCFEGAEPSTRSSSCKEGAHGVEWNHHGAGPFASGGLVLCPVRLAVHLWICRSISQGTVQLWQPIIL